MIDVCKVEFLQRKVDVKSNDIVKDVQGRHEDISVVTCVQRNMTNAVSHG